MSKVNSPKMPDDKWFIVTVLVVALICSIIINISILAKG